MFDVNSLVSVSLSLSLSVCLVMLQVGEIKLLYINTVFVVVVSCEALRSPTLSVELGNHRRRPASSTYNIVQPPHVVNKSIAVIANIFLFILLQEQIMQCLLGRVAHGAQRPRVVKLSRGRSVGLSVGRSVQCIVKKRRIG